MQNPTIATPKEERRRGFLSRRGFIGGSLALAGSTLLPTAPIKGLEWLLKQAEASTGEVGLKDYIPPGFRFGVVLNNSGEWNTKVNDWDQYLGSAAREFNYVVNNFFYLSIQKLSPTHSLDFNLPDEIMHFAADNNMKARGHALVQNAWLPSWFSGLSLDKATSIYLDYISQTVSRYKDWKCANGEKLVDSWIATNELFFNDWDSTTLRNDDVFWSKFESDDQRREFILKVYQTARAADPDAKLILNEVNIFFLSWPHTQAVYELAEWLVANGAGPDIIGVQSHLGANYLILFGNFNEFGENIVHADQLGFSMEATEADVNFFDCDDSTSTDQANVYAAGLWQLLDNLGLATGWSTWGHTDKYHWIKPCGEEEPGDVVCHCPTKPGGAILGPNYEPKEAYYAIRDTLIAAREAAAPAVRQHATRTCDAFGIPLDQRDAARITRLLQSGNMTPADLIYMASTDPHSDTHGLSPFEYAIQVYRRVLNEDPMGAGRQTFGSLLTDSRLTKDKYANHITASQKFKDKTKGYWMKAN